ncbi:MAG: Tol-Pal system beta propeller repeat protein TolB [Trichlorobacter sp.]
MKRYLILLMMLCVFCSSVVVWAADTAVEVTARGNRSLRLGIVAPQPTGASYKTQLADTMAAVHAFDMQMSGIVQSEVTSLPPLGHGLAVSSADYDRWATSGFELMVRGTYALSGDTLVTEFRLYDVIGKKMLTAKRYTGRAADTRKMAHLFSDEVVRTLTGEKGTFSAHIVFVSTQSGSKELHMMDWDGYGVQRLTNHHSILLSPDVSPNSTMVLFTSYRRGNPDLYVRNLAQGTDTILSGRRGLNITGAWSPDGKQVALSMSREGTTDIYLIDTKGAIIKRLTSGAGANVSPTWSPDGTKIAFISDRHGKPNLFVMNRDGSNVRKLAGGGYLATPAWSPKGDVIAFTRMSGGFQISVVTLDGAETQLTSSGNNERPRWSPDGRMIVFGSKRSGTEALYVMRRDGTGQTKVSRVSGIAQHPVWLP